MKSARFRIGLRIIILLLIAGFSIELRAEPPRQTSGGTSLRFYGNGTNDIDRVKIRIDGPERPADIGATDFTIEFWMMAIPGENGSSTCSSGGDNWVNGNIIVDRDIYGSGDYGDYGVALYGGVIAFGVNNGTAGTTLCGATNVVDSQWHHIALVRVRNSGLMQIYVDGTLDASTTGPTGDISYRNGRSTSWADDPFIVIGAEKHDISPIYPSFSGWVDELRLSTVRRYNSNFTPSGTAFQPDANTAALYHLDEGSGNTINDATGGNSNGVRNFGGSPAGPLWSTETPFSSALGVPAPIAPADLAELTNVRPTFSWSAVGGASGYEIEVSGDTGLIPPFTDVFETASPTYVPAMPLLPGDYSWRVRATSNGSQSEWSSPTRTFRIVSLTNAAPLRNLFATKTPTLSWGRITWATGYQIQVATDAVFTQVVFDISVGRDVLATQITEQPNGLYYWRVRALRPGTPAPWTSAEAFVIHAETP